MVDRHPLEASWGARRTQTLALGRIAWATRNAWTPPGRTTPDHSPSPRFGGTRHRAHSPNRDEYPDAGIRRGPFRCRPVVLRRGSAGSGHGVGAGACPLAWTRAGARALVGVVRRDD